MPRHVIALSPDGRVIVYASNNRLYRRSMSELDGLMRGRRQQDIADDLGISPSAVSHRVRPEGIGVLLAADELLRDL